MRHRQEEEEEKNRGDVEDERQEEEQERDEQEDEEDEGGWMVGVGGDCQCSASHFVGVRGGLLHSPIYVIIRHTFIEGRASLP